MADEDWTKHPSVLDYGVELIKDAAEADPIDPTKADMKLLAERVGLENVYRTMLDLAAALAEAVFRYETAEAELEAQPEPEPSPIDDAYDAHHRYRLRETSSG